MGPRRALRAGAVAALALGTARPGARAAPDFLLLPFIYLIPNILGNHLPLRVTRLLARIGGYWFIYGYYMTLLLVPAFIVWLVCLAQPFGFGLDWWHTVFAVYYGKASLLGLAALLAVGSWRARHPVVRRIEMETEKPIERAFSVAFASDIHLGAVLDRSFAAELRRDMMNLQPDLILSAAISSTATSAMCCATRASRDLQD